MKPETILWIYLVILLAGGVFGFVKAKSKISLVGHNRVPGEHGVPSAKKPAEVLAVEAHRQQTLHATHRII